LKTPYRLEQSGHHTRQRLVKLNTRILFIELFRAFWYALSAATLAGIPR
jgi:hypothetical protein